MNGHHESDSVRRSVKGPHFVNSEPGQAASAPFLLELSEANLNQPTVADARITSLKVLVLTLLAELESLESQLDSVGTLNLQKEVQRFEAALIRGALMKTGGRQRRAARLLGSKVTTLNTKIKRYGIDVKQPSGDPFLDRSRD